MYYNPVVNYIAKLLTLFNPKVALGVPDQPKRSRVLIMTLMGLVVSGGVIFGLAKLTIYVISCAGSLQEAQVFLMLLGVILIPLGLLILPKAMNDEEASEMSKWWRGQTAWWRVLWP